MHMCLYMHDFMSFNIIISIILTELLTLLDYLITFQIMYLLYVSTDVIMFICD